MSTHKNLNLLYRSAFSCSVNFWVHQDMSVVVHPRPCIPFSLGFLRFAPQPFLRVLFLVPTPAGVQKRNRRKAHLVPGT